MKPREGRIWLWLLLQYSGFLRNYCSPTKTIYPACWLSCTYLRAYDKKTTGIRLLFRQVPTSSASPARRHVCAHTVQPVSICVAVLYGLVFEGVHMNHIGRALYNPVQFRRTMIGLRFLHYSPQIIVKLKVSILSSFYPHWFISSPICRSTEPRHNRKCVTSQIWTALFCTSTTKSMVKVITVW